MADRFSRRTRCTKICIGCMTTKVVGNGHRLPVKIMAIWILVTDNFVISEDHYWPTLHNVGVDTIFTDKPVCDECQIVSDDFSGEVETEQITGFLFFLSCLVSALTGGQYLEK